MQPARNTGSNRYSVEYLFLSPVDKLLCCVQMEVDDP